MECYRAYFGPSGIRSGLSASEGTLPRSHPGSRRGTRHFWTGFAFNARLRIEFSVGRFTLLFVIALLDYGSGNLRSVEKALCKVGADVNVIARPEGMKHARAAVLPGVG